MAERVRVGVRLARPTEDLGGWLTHAAAFDAAGADALWLDDGAADEFDVVVLLAALAATTHRALLVGGLDGAAPAVGTLARLSRGRLGIVAEAVAPIEARDPVAVFHLVPDEGALESAEGERWVATEHPESRAAWRELLLDAAERGVCGLILPADPRLLDLLRNPDDEGDRRDLHLALG